jgi:hypothetical protein
LFQRDVSHDLGSESWETRCRSCAADLDEAQQEIKTLLAALVMADGWITANLQALAAAMHPPIDPNIWITECKTLTLIRATIAAKGK